MKIHLQFLKYPLLVCSFHFVITNSSNAQSSGISCKDLYEGTYYFYPVNKNEAYINYRSGDKQIESIVGKADTTVWELKWIDECTYSLRYSSGTHPLTGQELKSARKTLLVYEINARTEKYYTFTGYIDSKEGPVLSSDTMWLNERKNFTNQIIVSPITNTAAINKRKFNDTSSYAVLYLYRPGKMTNSLGNYPVYFDGNPIWAANNGSWMAFKVFKEGQFEIKSELQGDTSSVMVEIKFGQKTYVKSMIHWRFANRNFKLEMAEAEPAEAEEEMLKLTYR